jgi:hypothetical protein
MERMKRADKAWRARRMLAAAFVALGGAVFAGSAGADSRSCNESCDRKASDCLDACDAKHKDDKPRVECKMQCASERQKCESACPAPAPAPS